VVRGQIDTHSLREVLYLVPVEGQVRQDVEEVPVQVAQEL
jgi:hypothetical protein